MKQVSFQGLIGCLFVLILLLSPCDSENYPSARNPIEKSFVFVFNLNNADYDGIELKVSEWHGILDLFPYNLTGYIFVDVQEFQAQSNVTFHFLATYVYNIDNVIHSNSYYCFKQQIGDNSTFNSSFNFETITSMTEGKVWEDSYESFAAANHAYCTFTAKLQWYTTAKVSSSYVKLEVLYCGTEDLIFYQYLQSHHSVSISFSPFFLICTGTIFVTVHRKNLIKLD